MIIKHFLMFLIKKNDKIFNSEYRKICIFHFCDVDMYNINVNDQDTRQLKTWRF